MKPTITLNVTYLAWESTGRHEVNHECVTWCNENSIDAKFYADLKTEVGFDFVTCDRVTGVYAEFKNAADAACFKLRWSEHEI